jgi:hypothetical protein
LLGCCLSSWLHGGVPDESELSLLLQPSASRLCCFYFSKLPEKRQDPAALSSDRMTTTLKKSMFPMQIVQ